MTDINKTILEKGCWSYSIQSDGLTSIFGDLWGAVIASCTLEEARDKIYLEQYSTILTDNSFQVAFILFWSSPQLWMKTASYNIWKTKDPGLVASIVSDDCRHSHPQVSSSHHDHHLEFHQQTWISVSKFIWKERKTASPEKKSFWKRLFS